MQLSFIHPNILTPYFFYLLFVFIAGNTASLQLCFLHIPSTYQLQQELELPFASSTGRPQWCLISDFAVVLKSDMQHSSIRHFIPGEVWKASGTCEGYIPRANMYSSFTEVMTLSLENIKGARPLTLVRWRFFSSVVWIFTIPCYLCLTFVKSGNFVMCWCNGGSNLMFLPIGITYVLSCWCFHYPKRCYFRCKIKRTCKTMKYCMHRFTMPGIPVTESEWFSITRPRTIPLLVWCL